MMSTEHNGSRQTQNGAVAQDIDMSVSYPAAGRIHLSSRYLFSNPSSEHCREFMVRILPSEEVRSVSIMGAKSLAEIHYCPQTYTRQQAVQRLATSLRRSPNGHGRNGETPSARPDKTVPLTLHPDADGVIRLYRYGTTVTSWEVVHALPGRVRLRHPMLHRKKDMCHAIERDLMNVLGIDAYKTNALTSTVLITYDERKFTPSQILDIVETALMHAEMPAGNDRPDLTFPLSTVAVPLAAVAQFLAPPLLPVAAVLFAYTSIPSFQEAYQVLFKERRLGVDVLDSIVVVGCLATGSIFAGAMLTWCLSFGRVLVDKTRDNSQKMLLNVFGKQPRYVWLYQDGQEVEVLLDTLEPNDLIVVNTGEVVPVDGVVVEGVAMIDQHTLTGESAPAEKAVGDRVFASTVMLAGKVFVQVEKAGTETTSAQISQILNDSAGYRLTSQSRGEVLADKAVIPTLAMGAVGLATMGPGGGMAVLNSDFGTGIRMAAPLGMLTSLILCAQNGILVKDGRALELISQVDTVLFDKTGTLTRERPEVGEILACGSHEELTLLQYAAAAEHKFSHPIAKAILDKCTMLGLSMPATDDSKYHVGYGITVGVDGKTIRVGSARFMEMEGIALPWSIQTALDEAHHEGHSLVMVAVDDALGGALELRASHRPEAQDIIAGLRTRGIEQLAIISGDHEGPTRKLADHLGMDRYFAGVLPQDKARYVEELQREGRTVCFVGDGINDSIALKQASVSISLRGASSIATDTAQIVFMEESLAKLCTLLDIAHDLERNVKRSWRLILAPNIFCIGGAFLLGFGVMASVLTNNVAALAALANGMLPLRKAAESQAQIDMEADMKQELSRIYG